MKNLDFIVEAAIARYDWSALQESDGKANGIPSAFMELLDSSDPESSKIPYWKLDNHVVVQGSLFESSVCVVSLIGAALVDVTRPRWVKIQLLELFFQIVSGESHSDEVARGITDLGLRCRNEARKSLWILYGIFQEGELWEAAREVLELVDDDDVLLTNLNRINRNNGRFDISEPLKI